MKKLKLFIENFLVYGLGGIISKIIPLIMVPIVTRLMPSSEYYGISDLSNTVVSFGSALAIMGMYDAMYRMFFEKDDEQYKKTICSTALCFTIITSLIVFFVMIYENTSDTRMEITSIKSTIIFLNVSFFLCFITTVTIKRRGKIPERLIKTAF